MSIRPDGSLASWRKLLEHIEAGEPVPPHAPAGPGRWQDDVIVAGIAPHSTVLDLGCGNGTLLRRLMDERQVRGQGIELGHEQVAECIARGVPVIQQDIDAGLQAVPSDGFDVVVLEETLQTLHRPIQVLNAMLRVGRVGIVSFPNFGHWRVRLDLLTRGRMPITSRLDHQWHDTPNIHHLSLADFLDWAEANRVTIDRGYALSEGDVHNLSDESPITASEVLLFVRRD